MDTRTLSTITCDHGKTWDANDPHDPDLCTQCKAEGDAQAEQEWQWEAEQDRKIAQHEADLATRDNGY